jgi:hypothetical protein
MACGSGAADAPPVASTLRRNGDNSAGAAIAPATMPVATLALMKFLRVNFAMRFPFTGEARDRRTAPEPIRSRNSGLARFRFYRCCDALARRQYSSTVAIALLHHPRLDSLLHLAIVLLNAGH